MFTTEFNKEEEMPEQLEFYFAQFTDAKEKEKHYIQEKANAITAKKEEIDVLINEHATGWKTTRMNRVDLTILRLAVYEVMWDEEIPNSVAINEAVELAKKFSGEDGPAFINGVLAQIAE